MSYEIYSPLSLFLLLKSEIATVIKKIIIKRTSYGLLVGYGCVARPVGKLVRMGFDALGKLREIGLPTTRARARKAEVSNAAIFAVNQSLPSPAYCEIQRINKQQEHNETDTVRVNHTEKKVSFTI